MAADPLRGFYIFILLSGVIQMFCFFYRSFPAATILNSPNMHCAYLHASVQTFAILHYFKMSQMY